MAMRGSTTSRGHPSGFDFLALDDLQLHSRRGCATDWW
jgi:hypothetical protein